jgi:hypothetical protein
MLVTLAMLAALNAAPPPAGNLIIKESRLTFGVYGQKRPDNKVMPGDNVVLSYHVLGLNAGANLLGKGKTQVAIGHELWKKGNKRPVIRQLAVVHPFVLDLGGGVLATETTIPLPLNTLPGKYLIKVNVREMGTGATGTILKKIEVVKKFGFVRTRFTAGPAANNVAVPPVVVPGQSLHLHYALVGFEFDKKNLPDVSIEITIIDAATGIATTPKSAKARVKPAIKKANPIIKFAPIPLELYKSGRYQVKLTAKDNVSGATAERVLDLLVLDR